MNSTEKVLFLIETLKKERHGIRISDLSENMDMPISSVHRMLKSLIKYDYVRQDATTKRYGLSFKFLEISKSILDNIDIRQQIKPFLYELEDEVKEACHLSMLSGNDVVFIDRVDSSYSISSNQKIGMHCPAYLSASGNALLAMQSDAFLNEYVSRQDFSYNYSTRTLIKSPEDFWDRIYWVRDKGYALDDEEAEIGGRCIAMAVKLHETYSNIAISISGPTSRLSIEYMETVLANKLGKTIKHVISAVV